MILTNLLQVKAWIHEKFKVASDESYRDPTNLQSKLQKHQAFEAELSANKGRVDSVCKVSHHASWGVGVSVGGGGCGEGAFPFLTTSALRRERTVLVLADCRSV